jgi:hypothetical protein
MFFRRMKKIMQNEEVPMVAIPVVKSPAKPKTAKKATKTAASAVSKSVAKTAVKKKATATAEKLPLQHAEDESAFWVTDGQILKNLVDLAQTFAEMDAVVYQYHVAKERNDFADWVEHVLADIACAEALRRSKTPKTAHTVVIRHLKAYQI